MHVLLTDVGGRAAGKIEIREETSELVGWSYDGGTGWDNAHLYPRLRLQAPAPCDRECSYFGCSV